MIMLQMRPVDSQPEILRKMERESEREREEMRRSVEDISKNLTRADYEKIVSSCGIVTPKERKKRKRDIEIVRMVIMKEKSEI